MFTFAARRPRTAGLLVSRSWVRDFRLLMAGSVVSMLGSRISTVACPLLALFLTHSPFDAGLVAFAATIPSVLVYIPAGALVDRWDSRRTMLLSEVGRGVAITVVAVSLAVGRTSVLLLILVVIVEEILEVFSTLADRRCVRGLVPRERASSVQAGIESRTHVVVLVGRPLGVLLFGVMHILPFLADAASFVVSVLAIVNIKTRRIVEERIESQSNRISWKRLSEDIDAAWKLFLKDPYARAALILSAGTTLIGQALIIIFLAGARTSGLSSVWVGLVLAASGVGGVVGAAIAPRLRKPPKASLVLWQMLAWFMALVFLAVVGWHSFPCVAVVMATQSLAGALGNIEIDTHFFRAFDENMLAKVTSFGRFVTISASAVGPMLGGMLIQFWGAQVAVSALAGMTFVLVLMAGATPSMRNYRQRSMRNYWPRGSVIRYLRRWIRPWGTASALPSTSAYVFIMVRSRNAITIAVLAPGIALVAWSSGAPQKSSTPRPLDATADFHSRVIDSAYLGQQALTTVHAQLRLLLATDSAGPGAFRFASNRAWNSSRSSYPGGSGPVVISSDAEEFADAVTHAVRSFAGPTADTTMRTLDEGQPLPAVRQPQLAPRAGGTGLADFLSGPRRPQKPRGRAVHRGELGRRTRLALLGYQPQGLNDMATVTMRQYLDTWVREDADRAAVLLSLAVLALACDADEHCGDEDQDPLELVPDADPRTTESSVPASRCASSARPPFLADRLLVGRYPCADQRAAAAADGAFPGRLTVPRQLPQSPRALYRRHQIIPGYEVAMGVAERESRLQVIFGSRDQSAAALHLPTLASVMEILASIHGGIESVIDIVTTIGRFIPRI